MNLGILGNVFGKISVPENNFTKYGVKKTVRIFDPIIGFDDIKEIFQLSIKADKPVHILLVGPPASAKSLFMSCLTKLERSYCAVGSSSTKSGIFDYLFEHRPRYFIIDACPLSISSKHIKKSYSYRQYPCPKRFCPISFFANMIYSFIEGIVMRITFF